MHYLSYLEEIHTALYDYKYSVANKMSVEISVLKPLFTNRKEKSRQLLQMVCNTKKEVKKSLIGGDFCSSELMRFEWNNLGQFWLKTALYGSKSLTS